MIGLRARRCGAMASLTFLLTACGGAEKRAPEAPSTAPIGDASYASGASASATPAAEAAPAPVQAPLSPSESSPEHAAPARTSTDDAPSKAGVSRGRAAALREAGHDFDRSQRELDATAGDCRSVCRALASMDRAAGRVCSLTEGEPDGERCRDVSNRLYSARDRVRRTCGACPDGPSVERAAPIPSVP